MLFNSIDFAIFFPLVFVLYWVFFQKSIRYRNIFLLTVSYIFYGWWDWRFLSLIIISSLADFIIGQKIHSESSEKKRKKWLFVSIFINLGILSFFKYYNFFIDSFLTMFSFFGKPIESSSILSINIVLPVGISFYTFQTMSYTLDIYFKKMKPTKDIFAFFAFVSFFPQLVAGPIERAKDLLPQFFTKAKIDYENLRSGLLLMAGGLFKKIVIADRLSIFVDSAYKNIEQLDGISAFFAVLFFTFQLYLDFSAYSDIAIGTARLLGFKLSKNFDNPYLSISFSNFWNRWHITLSSWFRDYLYIPLGGNRCGKLKKYRNILIVFMLSGLWHGASWNFVIWGIINGLFLLIFDNFLNKINHNTITKIASSVFITMLWAFSLVFFRAQSFDEAILMLSKVNFSDNNNLYKLGLNELEFAFLIKTLIGFVVYEIITEKVPSLYNRFVNMPFIVRWALYISVVLFVLFYGSYGVGLDDNSFIYFQF